MIEFPLSKLQKAAKCSIRSIGIKTGSVIRINRPFLQKGRLFSTTDYQNRKSSKSLLKSLALYKLFSIEMLSNKSDFLYKKTNQILGQNLTSLVIKNTVYSEFIGGENVVELLKTCSKLAENNVGSILDYAVENEDASGIQAESGYAKCVEKFKECIDAASKMGNPHIAIKITALCNPEILQKMSNVINIRNFADNCKNLESLKQKLKENNGTEIREITEKNFSNLKKRSELKAFLEGIGKYFSSANEIPLEFSLNAEEIAQIETAKNRLFEVLNEAAGKGVKLFIDAEQTYFQPGIAFFSRIAQKEFNKTTPLILDTIQCYLKTSVETLENRLVEAKKLKYVPAFKLVCGAYMMSERARALEKDYNDPLNESKERTFETFKKCVDIILKSEKSDANNLTVASHNEDLVQYTLKSMEAVKAKRESVSFAQLYGMSDKLTFYLGKEGFMTFKYVPYGKVQDVMPYLIRRIQENQSMGERMKAESKELSKELYRRFSVRIGA